MHDHHTPIALRPLYNVPMALEETLTRTRGLEPELATARNRNAVEDAKKYTLGPMPVRAFLHDFLKVPHPCDPADLLASRGAFSRVQSNTLTSGELRDYLLTVLNKRTKKRSRCPGFVFDKPSSHSSATVTLADMRPDIWCYASHNAATVAEARVDDPSSRADFGYAELFIEIKSHPSHDFFVDRPVGVEGQDHDLFATSDDAAFNRRRDRAFGQHICHVTEVFSRQYRVKFFTVSVSGSRARFLRWDRGGCIVSESFDLHENPEILCEFLWLFSQTTSEIRGHDPTVAIACPQEEELFCEALRGHMETQLGVVGPEVAHEVAHAMREHYQPGYVVVVYVLAHEQIANADNLHYYLVSRPIVSPLHLTGRATRGFWAVDASTHRVVFLKDTWRGSLETEGEILERLHERGVRNIPSVVCHGDVPDYIPGTEYQFSRGELQGTLVDEYCMDPWVSNVGGKPVIVPKQWHYRMVLNTVGYGFHRISGTEELLRAAYDVFHALIDAHAQGHRLHRDISVGNIILVRGQDQPVRQGYLIDWDASCETDDDGEALEAGRAGTWLFMSNKVLASTGLLRKHTLQDDMESLLYVVLYSALLYLPHNLATEDLRRTIRLLFEDSEFTDGYFIGGLGKLDNAVSRTHTKSMEFNPSLKEWLDAVMNFCNPLRRWDNAAELEVWADPHLLDEFWSNFLKEHVLETNDRQPHDHPYVTDKYEVHSEAGRALSRETISLGKRPLEEDDGDEGRALKKARRAPAASAASLPQPLRRSQRLREQQKRSQPAKAAQHIAQEPRKGSRVRVPTTRRGAQAARRK